MELYTSFSVSLSLKKAMLLSLVQKPYFAPLPSFQSSHSNGRHHPLLKTLFIPSFISLASIKSPKLSRNLKVNTVCVASMLESPVLWLSRLIVFYVLIKTGIAGSPSNPFISSGTDPLPFFSLS